MKSQLLVVGSVAYDSVKTPSGTRERILGGSASYCAASASYFSRPSVLAVVGEDFRDEDRAVLERRGVDLSAMTTVSGAGTFHWKGEYGENLNEAITLKTDLNVLEQFDPVVPASLRNVPCLFLANIDPDAQLKVIEQVKSTRFIAADTMNFWIENKRDRLMRVLPLVDALIINEAEARDLTGEHNIFNAARLILSWGPETLVIKRGEYGVMLLSSDDLFEAPAYPLEKVVDPTGAGDSFAGGFMGFLAGTEFPHDPSTVRQAVIAGSVMASFDVGDFSLENLVSLENDQIEKRFRDFRTLTNFETPKAFPKAERK